MCDATRRRGVEMSEKSALMSVCAGFAAVAISCLASGCGTGSEQGLTVQEGQADRTVDCERLATPLERIECHVDRATQAGHPKPCREAAEEAVRYQCYAILAGRLKDATLCDDIPPSSDETRALRDTCLSDVAEVLKEAALCERIMTPGLCDSCYLKVARATGDTSLCDAIDDPGLKSGCTGEPVIVN
jgi:hypothetical protein